MVRCQVCGKNVVSGWICGILPAGAELKLALCPDHDTPKNRKLVQAIWELELKKRLARELTSARRKASPQALLTVHVHYLDGGYQELDATAVSTTETRDLLVLAPSGRASFYPLEHIRSYEVSQSETSEISGTDAPATPSPPPADAPKHTSAALRTDRFGPMHQVPNHLYRMGRVLDPDDPDDRDDDPSWSLPPEPEAPQTASDAAPKTAQTASSAGLGPPGDAPSADSAGSPGPTKPSEG